jgi:hypothetical protein
MRICRLIPGFFLLWAILFSIQSASQSAIDEQFEKEFLRPGAEARPWVFWYWMHGAISREGITADLEAMKEVGIAGAYLMPIKDTSSVIPFKPVVRQLTPEWWAMVRFAMEEAKRLDLKLAMHVSDGFALAGGPWITPELSMQKLVWTKTYIKTGMEPTIRLDQPASKQNFYKDVAVFAYPAGNLNVFDDLVMIPSVTTSNGTKANFLSFPGEGKESFRSDTTCWIEYKYPKAFTCRSIKIHVGGNNYQAHRLIVQASNDGKNYKKICRLEPPRHGWQDTDEDVTHAIPPTTARYFRFIYDKTGAEPGSEDIDAAKWKPNFKVEGIYLADEPAIHQYESKNGSIWRVSKQTSDEQMPTGSAVPLQSIINLTGKMDADGNLKWKAPGGKWIIVRIGHTSTGHTNATGGGGKGLECDKFNPNAIKLQFDNWFAQAFEKTDPALAREVLKIFHVDSWECGSQNWSSSFASEFRKRRGYDIMPYLVAMTGVPVESASTSEKFLQDVRKTIAELVNDVFYTTLNKLSKEKGTLFSAESVAPTMVSDGLLHYKTVDLPMGEFWLNSPTHDKPNDMHDAISGAHIYGKNIVSAEAFTSVRMNWAEHPGAMKVIGDRNFALGINRMVLHVFTHNPWIDRKPGMTLDGVGLYFQRDQTWFRQSKAWIDYLSRCQLLLQAGRPVVDIAVFTGDELPSRSILPDRLVNSLPGIFGKKKVDAEKNRLANLGHPMRSIPDGVNHSANMADPEDWIDPLNGYRYDSFNPDALMMMQVKNGKIVLPGGASYGLLVIPAAHPLQPNRRLSLRTARKLLQLVNDGATISMDKSYQDGAGLKDKKDSVKLMMQQLIKGKHKGKVYSLPHVDSTFQKQGISRDLDILNNNHSIAWTHRHTDDADIYFISNQIDSMQAVELSFRMEKRIPEVWDPVQGQLGKPDHWRFEKNRTLVYHLLYPNESLFIVFRKKTTLKMGSMHVGVLRKMFLPIPSWTVQFDTLYGGPRSPQKIERLESWTAYNDPGIKYYSGTAAYTNNFIWDSTSSNARIFFEAVNNIATVYVNNINCGTAWTVPFSVDISNAVKNGNNDIRIEVTNTWANRLIGDQLLPPEKRITWTTAPFRLKNKPLLPSGIIGEVYLQFE